VPNPAASPTGPINTLTYYPTESYSVEWESERCGALVSLRAAAATGKVAQCYVTWYQVSAPVRFAKNLERHTTGIAGC